MGMAASCSTGSDQPVEPDSTALAYEQKIKPSPASSFERLGRAVDVAGQVLVVSSLGSFAPGSAPGVYAFRHQGERWVREAVFSDEMTYPTGFGHAVGTDGTNIVVTAPMDGGVASRAGAAYLFSRSTSGWQSRATFEPSPATADGLFGSSMAMDDARVAFGAPGGEREFVYVFELSHLGGEPSAVLESPDVDGLRFGSKLALSGDWLAVGGGSDDEDLPGNVYLYRQGAGSWQLFGTIQAPPPVGEFGTSLALEGASLLVGAVELSGDPAVYAYRWNGKEWQRDGRLEPQGEIASNMFSTSHFGAAVALNGRFAIVGAPGSEREGEAAAGVAYQFQRTESGWQQQFVLETEQRAEDAFGAAVATDGEFIAVGETGDDEGAQDSGAVYIFHLATEGGGGQQ